MTTTITVEQLAEWPELSYSLGLTDGLPVHPPLRAVVDLARQDGLPAGAAEALRTGVHEARHLRAHRLQHRLAGGDGHRPPGAPEFHLEGGAAGRGERREALQARGASLRQRGGHGVHQPVGTAAVDERLGGRLRQERQVRIPGLVLRDDRHAVPAEPDEVRQPFSPHERLLILDTWQRSGLPAGDFAPLVGISKHTLYLWKKRFTQHGPAGLAEQPRGASTGSRLSEVTKRTIVMLKELHADWGCQRISDELLRGPALAASPSAVARVLHEAGYQVETRPTRPHPEKVQRFERAKPNQLWHLGKIVFNKTYWHTVPKGRV